jgi:hypothetical protein
MGSDRTGDTITFQEFNSFETCVSALNLIQTKTDQGEEGTKGIPHYIEGYCVKK